MENKGKLSPITFLYGFGAAVVLVGAMFKFVGWNYANEMFVVGLSIEAIVFLISAFERNTEDKEYEWENVFPQLDGKNGQSNVQGYADAMNEFGKTMSALNNDMAAMAKAVQEMRQGMEKMGALNQQMESLSNEVSNYNKHLKQINSKFEQFSK